MLKKMLNNVGFDEDREDGWFNCGSNKLSLGKLKQILEEIKNNTCDHCKGTGVK